MLSDFWSPIILSLEVATVSSVFVLIFGLIVARKMSISSSNTGKVFIDTLFILPLVLPPSVVGFLLIVLFGMNSPIGRSIEWVFNQPIMFTWWAAVLAATVVAFPLMYQTAKAGFQSVDVNIENAARVDGASEWNVLLFVSIPLAFRSIITGFILSFARALGEFGATLMFAGNIPRKTQTIPTAIYVAMDSGDMKLAWMWVGTMIGISMIMLLIIQIVKHVSD